MLLSDVQSCGTDILHLTISTKAYWWHQLLSNGGNLFVCLIVSLVTFFIETNKIYRIKRRIIRRRDEIFVFRGVHLTRRLSYWLHVP